MNWGPIAAVPIIAVVFLAVAMLFTPGCARQENLQVDPKAFSFWVVPF